MFLSDYISDLFYSLIDSQWFSARFELKLGVGQFRRLMHTLVVLGSLHNQVTAQCCEVFHLKALIYGTTL